MEKCNRDFLKKYSVLEIAPKTNPEKPVKITFFVDKNPECFIDASNIKVWEKDKIYKIFTLGIGLGKILAKNISWLIYELNQINGFIIKFKSKLDTEEILLQEILLQEFCKNLKVKK